MKCVFVPFLIALTASAALEAGDTCGTNGVCTNIRQCASAIDDIRKGKIPQTCGFNGGDPIVCCLPSTITTATAPTPVLTTSKRTPSTTTTEYIPPVYDYIDVGDKSADGCEPVPSALTAERTGQKAWDKCVDYQEQLVFPCDKSNALVGGLSRTNKCHHNADELIIGGSDAAQDEYPHMALLGYGEQPNLSWLCGGSLISENFILTAGHCISSRDAGPVTYVLVGVLRRSADLLSGRNLFRVRNILKYPEYRPPTKYHDIALLELEKPVQLSDTLVPACLHTGAPLNASRASATGWGLTQYNKLTSASDTLQKVILEKFETMECVVKYQPNRNMKSGFDASTQTCYGDRTLSKDTCQGDSGGPLQVNNKKIACMHTIVGVTSFGQACGFAGQPGIYTRVAPYIGWIEQTVWPNN